MKMSADQGELSHDDPFAELTRIMGHDPQSLSPLLQGRKAQTNDLALELENELMAGAVPQQGSGRHTQAEIIQWRDAAWQDEQSVIADSAHGAVSSAHSAESLLEAELDSIFDAGEPGNGGAYGDEHAVPGHPLDGNEPFSAGGYDSSQPRYAAAAPAQSEAADWTFRAATPARTPLSERQAAYHATPSPEMPEPFWGPQPPRGSDRTAENQSAALWHEQEIRPAEQAWDEAFQSEQSHDALRAPRHVSLQPEIETVEVAQAAVPVTHHLDIPEVRYREEVKPSTDFDEIEEILAGAFGEAVEAASHEERMAGDPAVKEAPGAGEDGDIFGDDFTRSIAAAAGIEQGGGVQDAYPEFASQPADIYHQQDWASPHAHDSLKPAPGIAPPPPAAGSRLASYSTLAIGLIGGVVILGGAALLAMSFTGGGSDEPVLVAAEDSPIKVRPENPGGIQIPNQDNPVYRRVSGEQAADARPAQQQLITTTEEPVDLPQPEEVRSDLPGVDVGDDIAAKIEERLTNSAEETADESVIALTPRRVRSLVVRPDGTMVPREIPEPAETTGTTAERQTEAPVVEVAAASTDETQPEAARAEESPATVPSSGPIPPARPANVAVAEQPQTRSDSPGILTRREAPQPPAAQQVAAVAAPAPTAAAAASEWSVQISSQPTVESAQQSYQQLAQRYGEMLQGRGVNIVKAEIEGKGTYYRVRIPSNSKDDAIQLCERLKGAGGSCFVSK